MIEPSSPNDEQIYFLFLCLMVVIYLASLALEKLVTYVVSKWPGWWRKNVIDEFPYPEPCWDCKRGECKECTLLK